jgi:hypothetical protein
MKTFFKIVLCLLFSWCSFTACSQTADKTAAPVVKIPATMEQKQFNGFSITIPSGWEFSQGGNCSDLGFISWDPAHPDRQFFYHGMGGYFYLNTQQKQVDDNYVAMGGIRSPLIGKPVVNPVTPENFISNFYKLGNMPDISLGRQKIPELYNVQVISSEQRPSQMPGTQAVAALVRAVFTDRNKTKTSEGIFLVTVMPFQMANWGPGASFGAAFSFMGITAPLNELEALLPVLTNCMQSFDIDPSYAQNCMQMADRFTQVVIQRGKTLSESSGSIMKSWENRSRTHDIISQKRSDAMMGRERLYDPQTKTVYQIDNTFLDRYRSEPGKYNLNNLQKLPADDYTLWKQPALNGADHIRRVN